MVPLTLVSADGNCGGLRCTADGTAVTAYIDAVPVPVDSGVWLLHVGAVNETEQTGIEVPLVKVMLL